MENQELCHYGVKGMKWGVRRASKRLTSSKSTDRQREKAFESLSRHYRKGSAKVAKLDKKQSRLEATRDKRRMKNDPKAAGYMRKAAKYERKASKYDRIGTKYLGKAARKRNQQYGLFTSVNRAVALDAGARKLEARGNYYTSRSNILNAKVKSLKAKANNSDARSKQMDMDIEAVVTKSKLYRTELSNIDKAVTSAGKEYVDRLYKAA